MSANREREMKDTIRKMNRYCAALEEHFREIGRIALGCEEGKAPADIVEICQKALGETGVLCFWPEGDAEE